MAALVTLARWLQVAGTRGPADNADVNTVIIEVRRGADAKLYPARPLTREQRNRARWMAHNLVHRDGLSIRQAQRVMASQYGVRRAVGTIMRDLQNFECPRCPHMLSGQIPPDG